MLCCHCGQRPRCRPRGLCWTCYYDANVRCLYSIRPGKFTRRGSGLRRAAHACALPTRALPGSPEKILVLMRRAELGQDLWHPDDATFSESMRLDRAS
jgi:hypothetical protein